MRAILTILLASTLFASASFAAETTTVTDVSVCDPPAVEELKDDMRVYLQRWREDEELLGERRRQRLQVARYHLFAEEFGRPLADDPTAFEETKDILLSCVSKLARARLERTPLAQRFAGRMESLGDSLRTGDGDGTWSFRVSPRVGLGSHGYYGAHLRLQKSPDDLWSHFLLGFRQRFEENEHSLYLQYQDGDRFVRLEHVDGDELAGDRYVLSLRVRF